MELQNVEFFIIDLVVKVNCYTLFKIWEIWMASKIQVSEFMLFLPPKSVVCTYGQFLYIKILFYLSHFSPGRMTNEFACLRILLQNCWSLIWRSLGSACFSLKKIRVCMVSKEVCRRYVSQTASIYVIQQWVFSSGQSSKQMSQLLGHAGNIH